MYEKLILPYHYVKAFRSASRHDYPASGMKVIGVTGTSGKTTTCFFIYEMLKAAGFKVGLMTTVGWTKWNDKEIKPQTAHATTENPEILNKNLVTLREAGCEYLVLEVTSHALNQHRIFGVPIDTAVFTNLSHEHLDYHKNMKNYRKAKEKLFKLAARNPFGKKLGIVNADDSASRFFVNDIPNILSYGIDNGDFCPRQLKLSKKGADYFLKFHRNELDLPNDEKDKNARKLHIKTKIPAMVNVYNSLAAIAVGVAYDLSDKQIEQGIAKLESVEGRMNRICEGQKFEVVVDFAHTADEIERILSDVRKVAKGRIISVFGSAGKRDETKRPEMGRVAAENSEVVILTEDDPRGEVRPISEQIAEGAEKSGKIRAKNLDDNLAEFLKFPNKISKLDTKKENLFLIDDRESAIKFAFSLAHSDDTILLLGKGHEKSISRSSGEEFWDEAKIARKLLKKLNK